MKMPLLLVSGLLSNRTLWKHQAEHLSQIASVHIACPCQDTPEKMVEETLAAAPPSFALAGHSMGGWLCLEIMRAAPQRVKKLCLLNTTASVDSEEKRKRRQELIDRVKNGGFAEVVKEITDLFVFQQAVKSSVAEMFLEVGVEAFINQESSMMIRSESTSILASIACPTLIIHAAQDKNFCYEDHAALAKQIRHATLAAIEDAGHMCPMEMPQATTALLRYWLTY